MIARRMGFALWTVWSLAVAGCDPVRTTVQSVRLRVVDLASGQPLVGAQVAIKVDFDRDYPLSAEWRQPKEKWHEQARRHWKEDLPWFVATTDTSGQADIEVESVEFDRTWGSTPPPERDAVSGRPYLVRIKRGTLPEEELSLTMKPGESANRGGYTVVVATIQSPHYVKE